MKPQFIHSTLLFVLLLVGCQTTPLDGDIIPIEPSKNDAIPTVPMKEYNDFWLATTRLDFSFEMTAENLQHMSDAGAIKNDIRNDIYFPMTLHITMNEKVYLLNEVGIRIKGNIYSRGPIAEAGVLTAPSGFKLSFNETFSESYYTSYGLRKTWSDKDPAFLRRKDRTLFGMEKLDLKWNRSGDPSLITQAFSYGLFKEWTFLSPQSTLSTLTFKVGETETKVGLYMLNEPIDKTLIRRYFNKAESQGDLYKALWPVDLNLVDFMGRSILFQEGGKYVVNPEAIGVENTFENYHPTYDLKTNKKTSKHEHLIRLITTLQTIGNLPLSQRKAALESVVHIPSFLKYAAASYLMGNPDDMRANVNNTYIYFHPMTGQAYFIPYDYDWTLGLTWAEDLDEKMRNASPLYNISPVHSQTISNPLLWFTLLEERDGRQWSENYPLIQEYQATYLDLIETWKDSDVFSLQAYQDQFKTYRKTYLGWTSSMDTYSYFRHTERFRVHRDGILLTLKNFFNN